MRSPDGLKSDLPIWQPIWATARREDSGVRRRPAIRPRPRISHLGGIVLSCDVVCNRGGVPGSCPRLRGGCAGHRQTSSAPFDGREHVWIHASIARYRWRLPGGDMAALTKIFDVPAEMAASCAILLWLVMLCGCDAAGLALAHHERLSLRKLSEESHKAEEAEISGP